MKKVSSIYLLSMLGLILGTGVAHAQTIVKKGEVVAHIKEYRVLATQLETCKQNPMESSNTRFRCEVNLEMIYYAVYVGSKIVSGENQFELTGRQPGTRFGVLFAPKLGGYEVSIQRYGRRATQKTARPFDMLEKAYKKAEGTVFHVYDIHLED